MPGNLVSRFVDRMGNTHLRSMKKRKQGGDASERNDQDQEYSSINQNADNAELWAMKRLIKEKPNVFILNNLLMSIQLFSNYEKEMEEARRKLEASEAMLNQNLLPRRSVLLPDVLQEHFSERVRFTSQCKSDKDDLTVEPIRPVKIYVKYENVLVTEVDETQLYSDPKDFYIDYNFVIKEADVKGYVLLEQRKLTIPKPGPSSNNVVFSSIAENEGEIYSDDGSVYGPLNNRSNLLGRSTSTSMPDLMDEDEYYDDQNLSNGRNGHAKVAPRSQRAGQSRASTAPNSASSNSSGATYALDSDSDSSTLSAARSRAEASLDSDKPQDGSDIPASCMKTVTYTYDGRIYNPKRESKPLNRQQRRIRDAKLAQNKDVVYVNGYRLAKYFYEGFKDQLSELLGFDESTVKSSKRCDATIRLEKIAYLSPKDQSPYVKIEPYEVTPCFSSPWPKWARGWLERRRGEWPAYEDLRHAEKFGCCLVPETSRSVCVNESPVSSLWKLDWSLSFPAAERYLETCLSASQLTVFTVALMLHKTFIRALGSSFGLETGHVRNMVFWIAEAHPEWSYQQMGQWMLELLESLHSDIQKRAMPDYFMRERNLFASVNTDDLLHAQKQLKRIIENPVMFVFHAMEKMQYERPDCYPRLDHAKLLKLLTQNELVLRNPYLEPRPTSESGESYGSGYGRREPGKDFWTEAKQNNQQYMQTRRRSARTIINPRRVHDSVIDIQETCESLSVLRTPMIMEFFAEHFLAMARCCHELAAKEPKRAYLDQTSLLGQLLAESPDYQEASSRILRRVQELRDSAIQLPDNEAPETPRRNSELVGFKKQVSYADDRDDRDEGGEERTGGLSE